MARKTLSDVESNVNSQANAFLGHTIKYKIEGESVFSDLTVQADYEPEQITGSSSVAIDLDVLILLPKVLLSKPSREDRVMLPRITNKTYYPTNIKSDETGFNWLFNLKLVSQ